MKLITPEYHKSYAMYRPLFIKFTIGEQPKECEDPIYGSMNLSQVICAFVLHYRKDEKGIYRREDEITPVEFTADKLVGCSRGGYVEASIEKGRYPVIRAHVVAGHRYAEENALLVYPSLKLENHEVRGQAIKHYFYHLGYGGKNPEWLPTFQEEFARLDGRYPWPK